MKTSCNRHRDQKIRKSVKLEMQESTDLFDQLSISLLGPLEIRRGEQHIFLRNRKAAALLAYLVTERQNHTRDYLAALLYPDSPDDRARATLRQTLGVLRTALGAVSDTILLIERDTLAFNTESGTQVDLLLLENALNRTNSRADSDDARALLQQAAAVWRGEFLQGLTLNDAVEFDEWVTLQREHWHRAFSVVLESASQRQQDHGDTAGALGMAIQWRLHDRLNESAYRRLMELHFTLGNRAAALGVYQSLRTLLMAELGVEPMPETTLLAERIQTETPRPEAKEPTPNRVESAVTLNNVPYTRSSILGRAHEITELIALLSDSQTRLLTLTGTAGVGKTRLAVEAAHRTAAIFDRQAWFIGLESVSDPGLVLEAIANTLSIHTRPGQSISEALTSAIGDRPYLLILDNFEQLLPGASALYTLLEACPKLKLLVTSREALHITIEHVFTVTPLALPDLSQNAAVIGQSPAVALFIRYAESVLPDFTITANLNTVAQLCAQLDGLPLAIELAASRSNILSPAAMLTRLQRQIPLPGSTRRDAPVRHRTLHAAVQSSDELLPDSSRVLFRTLSIFAGGWTLESAGAVSHTNSDLFESMTTLLNNHLITVDGRGDSRRFSMLFTIRDYARNQLEQHNETSVVQARHAEWFLRFAEEKAGHIQGAAQHNALNALEADQDNLRLALNYYGAVGDLDRGMALCKALSQFWKLRGYVNEALRWTKGFLDRLEQHPDAQESHPIALADALNRVGFFYNEQGKYDVAHEYYARGLTITRTLPDSVRLASALNDAALNAIYRADYLTAQTCLDESLTLFQAVGDQFQIGYVMNRLGHVALQLKQYPQAWDRFEQALGIFRKLEFTTGIAGTLNNLGLIAKHQARFVQARTLYEESLTLARRVDDKASIARTLLNLGEIGLHESSFAQALAHYREALILCQQHDGFREIAAILRAVGLIAGQMEQPEASVHLLAAGEAARETYGFLDLLGDVSVMEATVQDMNTQVLGSSTYQAEWSFGRVMSLEAAAGLAMQVMTTT